MAQKPIITGTFTPEHILTEDSDSARDLYNQSVFGTIVNKKTVHLSFVEALYLMQKNRLRVYDGRKKELTEEEFIRKARKKDTNFLTRFIVFSDLRDRGYIVKTALKFGGDFRVYDRGIKPGEDHAKWVVFPVHESSFLTWYDFAAKNRVAHSTRKRLLLAVVDAEDDVSYWESRWIRP